ncbi:MAG: cutinase [Mycobacterium sp.]|nr:cutinase [Mycobacterium sp.]
MIRRIGLAGLIAGMTLAGFATGTASAAPECADFHWIGAAGSGQRDAAGLTTNGGMGGVVYQSYLELRSDLAAGSRTIDAEAVQYPAAPVPVEGGLGGWMGFMDSVKAGTDATAQQYEKFTQRCPNTKVVLAGYSQGAMVIHRNLHDLADDPHVAAALLIADGDRLPVDNTINMGSTASLPSALPGKGVAQEHSFLASAPTAKLPAEIGARTLSVCDVGDPVCDYDAKADAGTPSPAAIAIHTSYAPAASGEHAWGAPLYYLVTYASPAPTSATELSASGA